ncbi:MAG TPA: glutaredoxin family protein [Gemmataceae bacterium]|nr:glutaredoxin family protein [Gemmataceae bacterium]
MLWGWFGRDGPCKASAGRPVLFYTRRGCHLCEEAWQVVQAAQKKHGFTLTAVDVDGDPTLAAEHGDCVPVVAIDGKVRFRGRVNAVLLERMLRN